MKTYDIKSIRNRLGALSERANEALGSFDKTMLGLGRYVPGTSPWERHTNGDELLLVTDGQVHIEVLDDDGSSRQFAISEGALFVVPRGKWHQLTATDNVNILFASPSEAGAERTRDHPFEKRPDD
jgi:mannose-6-phosphate isomerase-like protein (cupin superfamily)